MFCIIIPGLAEIVKEKSGKDGGDGIFEPGGALRHCGAVRWNRLRFFVPELEKVSVMSEINTAPLLAAIQDGKPWLDRFTKKDYDMAYQEYRERYAPLYREAALSAGEEGLEAVAGALLNGLAEGWARRKPWNRSVTQMTDKQMVVFYLSPMLLEDPVCAPLAEELRKGWAARWPKEAYRTAPQSKLRKGFRTTFLGIPLYGSKDEEDD